MNIPVARKHPGAIAALVVALVALAAYANSFSGPFIFDDSPSIIDNPSIRDLSAWREVLSPPVRDGITVAGRPMLNLSLALNYAIGGIDVRGYHAGNLALHVCAGLLLFGLVRRTLLLPRMRERFANSATSFSLSLAVAVLWVLHPLQTESVTYIIQRAESLAAVFYLLTLYAFVRGAEPDSRSPRCWWTLACVACALGMASKETVATAPLVVWLYDRIFVAGSFPEAWKKRRALLLGLTASWILLATLVASTGWNRGGSMGFGINIAWWEYALTQPRAIATYLRLALWPHPLVFSYESAWIKSAWQVVPYALVVVPLLAATAVALRRRPALGFLGAFFFVILAPSSSVIAGGLQTTVEHRMYLPLAAIVVLVVFGVHALVGRRSWIVFAALAFALGVTTARRNHDYRSVLAIWSDALAKRPDNALALFNAGTALVVAGRVDDAIAHFENALRLEPGKVDTLYNLGLALAKAGRTDEAIARLHEALRIKPDDVGSGRGLADALVQADRLEEALSEYARVLRFAPADPDTHFSMADALARVGRWSEAIEHYEAGLRAHPGSSSVYNNFGNALLASGRPRDAFVRFEQSVKLDPQNARAHFNLGNSFASSGRFADAVVEFDAAAHLEPANADAHNNLGVLLLKVGRTAEARAHFEEALRLRPDFARARANLEGARAK